MTRTPARFSSSWAVLLATIGMAVGTGNIWRFPRIAAQNGGGEFLIPWLIFLVLWAIPLLLAEFAIGKRSRRSPAAAVGATIGGGRNWMGLFIGFVTVFITFYYSVVVGWCLKYLVASATGQLQGADMEAFWQSFRMSGTEPLIYHGVSVAITAFIIYRGVSAGIERVNRYLIPTLFILLVGAAIRAVTLPGAADGLRFLFLPDLANLADYRIWLAALTQTAWSTGAGWGLVIVLGSYIKSDQGFVRTGILSAVANNLASLLAGVAVIGSVFALSASAESIEAAFGAGNEGLTFLWLPRLFLEMPGGAVMLPLFFLALSCAAISSFVTQLELVNRMVMDVGLPRKRSVPAVAVLTFACGIPSAISMGFFNNQDWTWGAGLMISGLFVALTVIRAGAARFREDYLNSSHEEWRVGRWFDVLITWVVPLEFIALITWWVVGAARESGGDWWHPVGLTVGTVALQSGLLALLCLVAGGAVWRRARAAASEADD